MFEYRSTICLTQSFKAAPPSPLAIWDFSDRGRFESSLREISSGEELREIIEVKQELG